MHTGKIWGIVDGTTPNLSAYLWRCASEFGIKQDWTPATRDPRHTAAIKSAKSKISHINKMTEEELIASKTRDIKSWISSSIDSQKSTKKSLDRLLAMKGQMEQWIPPQGENYENFINHTTKELSEAISRYTEDIANYVVMNLETELQKWTAESIRAELITSANRDIAYAKKSQKQNRDNVREHNTYASGLIESFPASEQ